MHCASLAPASPQIIAVFATLVDTNPSTEEASGVAIYSYDSGGERVIKKVFTNAKWQVTDSGKQEPVTDFMRGTYTATLYPSGLLNMTVTRRGCDKCNPFDRKYTKHYYAGSQRIMSKLGSDPNIGKFDCPWLIIPFSDGVPAINTEEILVKTTAAEDKLLKKYNITPAPDYGQNAGFLNGYNSKCVPSHGIDFAQEKQDSYWYHSDHLGSASYVTAADGTVCQAMAYLPTGELFVDKKYASYNSPYKFNGKEQDSETGYYYYGARYYNPKVSLWLNVDPLAEQTGQPYIAFNNNPVRFIDPTGMASKPYDWYQKQSDGSYKNIKKSNDLRIYDEQGSRVHETTSNIIGMPAYNEDYVNAVNYANNQGVISASDSYQASVMSKLYAIENTTQGLGNAIMIGAGVRSILKNPKAAWNSLKSLGSLFTEAKAAKTSTKMISQFSSSTIDDAVGLVMKNSNDVKHIFAAKHNLGPLVNKLGGQENTIRSVLNAANGKLPASGVFNNIPVNVGGQTIFLRGNVINGVPRIGTMFIP
jgi:RHS repeat-associated protein